MAMTTVDEDDEQLVIDLMTLVYRRSPLELHMESIQKLRQLFRCETVQIAGKFTG